MTWMSHPTPVRQTAMTCSQSIQILSHDQLTVLYDAGSSWSHVPDYSDKFASSIAEYSRSSYMTCTVLTFKQLDQGSEQHASIETGSLPDALFGNAHFCMPRVGPGWQAGGQRLPTSRYHAAYITNNPSHCPVLRQCQVVSNAPG